MKEETIIFIDLTKATKTHILLFIKLFDINNDLFKNNIVILGGDENFKLKYKERYKTERYKTLKFLIKGGISGITTRKLPTDNDFIFFCRRLKNMMFDRSFNCLYCLENVDNNFFTCNNCSSLICNECFEEDFIKNSDTLLIANKECSICKERKNYIFTTPEFKEYEIEKKQKELSIKKMKYIKNQRNFYKK